MLQGCAHSGWHLLNKKQLLNKFYHHSLQQILSNKALSLFFLDLNHIFSKTTTTVNLCTAQLLHLAVAVSCCYYRSVW